MLLKNAKFKHFKEYQLQSIKFILYSFYPFGFFFLFFICIMSDYQSVIQSLAARTETPFVPEVDEERVNEAKEYGKEIISGAGGLLAGESATKLYKRLKTNSAFKKLGISDEDMDELASAIAKRDFGSVAGQLQSKVAGMTKDGIRRLADVRSEFASKLEAAKFQPSELGDQAKNLLGNLTDKSAFQDAVASAKAKLSPANFGESDRLPNVVGSKSLRDPSPSITQTSESRLETLYSQSQEQFNKLGAKVKPLTSESNPRIGTDFNAGEDDAVNQLASRVSSLRGTPKQVETGLSTFYSKDPAPLVKDTAQGVQEFPSVNPAEKLDPRYVSRAAPDPPDLVTSALEDDILAARKKSIRRTFLRSARDEPFDPEARSDIISRPFGSRKPRNLYNKGREIPIDEPQVEQPQLPKELTQTFEEANAEAFDDVAKLKAKLGTRQYELPKINRTAVKSDPDFGSTKPSGITESQNANRIKAESNSRIASNSEEAKAPQAEFNPATTDSADAGEQIIKGSYQRGSLRISSEAKRPVKVRRRKAVDEGTQSEQPQPQQPPKRPPVQERPQRQFHAQQEQQERNLQQDQPKIESAEPTPAPKEVQSAKQEIEETAKDPLEKAGDDAKVPEDLAEGLQAERAEKTGEIIEKGLQKATELSEAADESPIGDVITGVLGIGSLIGGLFLKSHSHHFVKPPAPPQADSYSYQIGVD